MLDLARDALSVLIGFGSGVVIAGAVFAFITVVGVVPRLAQKTKTQTHSKIYESSIALGGILGTIGGFMQVRLPLPAALAGGGMGHGSFPAVAAAAVLAIFALCVGIFYGSVAMSLAEILDVMPILTRRGKVQKGIFIFVFAIAIGKMVGSLLYFLVPGFYK